MRERGLRRRRRRSGLKSKLKRSVKKQLATLKKLYNCPKKVSAKPHKAPLKRRSVKNVVVLIYLMYKLRWRN